MAFPFGFAYVQRRIIRMTFEREVLQPSVAECTRTFLPVDKTLQKYSSTCRYLLIKYCGMHLALSLIVCKQCAPFILTNNCRYRCDLELATDLLSIRASSSRIYLSDSERIIFARKINMKLITRTFADDKRSWELRIGVFATQQVYFPAFSRISRYSSITARDKSKNVTRWK